ncbi:TPA: hypothetical protein ACMDPN_003553, partial [Vibrio cholerae]
DCLNKDSGYQAIVWFYRKITAFIATNCITNASRGTVNAWRFQSQLATVVAVVLFEFSGDALSAP